MKKSELFELAPNRAAAVPGPAPQPLRSPLLVPVVGEQNPSPSPNQREFAKETLAFSFALSDWGGRRGMFRTARSAFHL